MTRAQVQGPVCAWLRAATREHHVRAEAAVDLSAHTQTIAGYRRLLDVLGQFHFSVEGSLSAVTPLSPPGLRAAFDTRRRRYADDRQALGDVGSDRLPAAEITGLEGVARQLGAWYVLEGSALGGLVIARLIARRLPTAAGAVGFLSGDRSRTAARWRSFQHFADTCAEALELSFDEVGRGAELAFEHFVSLTASLDEGTA